ncbi:MAG: SHOCT domain-containing protein [Pseudomonadota bacterium]
MMGDGFGMGLGGGFMWLFWIPLILVIVWAVKAVVGIGNSPTDKGKSALDILKERYAKGEIDQEEFEQKRKDLDG